MIYTKENAQIANEDIAIYKDIRIEKGVLFFDENTTVIQYISITDNKEIKEIKFVYAQPNLQYLDISSCSVSKIEFVDHCCPQLKSLYLHHNELESIDFSTVFPDLQLLDLSFNKKLTDINLSDASRQLPKLKYLYLHDCDLKSLEVFSKYFIKSDNDFNIGGNGNLQIPPQSYIAEKKDKIRGWFRQRAKYGKKTFYEAKILIVGEGKVGKTSFMKKLFNEDYVLDPSEKSTHGVNVKPNKEFSHPTLPNINISTSIWDFGGQDIQYFLHHFFLTKDALYVLVRDVRKQDTRFYYWFQIINFLGGKYPNVIVLHNSNEKVSDTIDKIDLKNYNFDFPNIEIEESELDLSKVNSRGEYHEWENLKNIISKKLIDLSTVGQEGNVAWELVKNELNRIKKDEELAYIDKKRLYEIATNKKIGMFKEDVSDMLEYFSKVGVVVHFNDDRNLRKYIYLNPNWITKAIYDPLNKKNFQAKEGVFTESWIFNFWGNKNYDEDEKNALLDLMQKNNLDICYPFGEKKYVVPFLVPDEMPSFEWDNRNNIELVYEYEKYIPEGVISQFIVRMHEKIEVINERQNIWKTGVILKKENARAIIRMHTSNKQIKIKVSGAGKSDFRGEIMGVFESIFNRYPSKPDVKVPCICAECSNPDKPTHYFAYDILVKFKQKGKTTAECALEGVDVVIDTLIEGINAYRGSYLNKEHFDINMEKQRKTQEEILKNQGKIISKLDVQFEKLQEIHKSSGQNFDLIKTKINDIQELQSDDLEKVGKQIEEKVQSALNEVSNKENEKYKELLSIFESSKKSSNWGTKVKLSIPILNLLGINIETEYKANDLIAKFSKNTRGIVI